MDKKISKKYKKWKKTIMQNKKNELKNIFDVLFVTFICLIDLGKKSLQTLCIFFVRAAIALSS